MLTLMREMLRSKLSGVLFALIIVSMAVWGVSDIFSGRLGQDLVQAGDRRYGAQDLDRSLERFLANQRNQGGPALSPAQAVERGIVDQIFAVEAARLANLGFAERIGARATTEAVMADIRETEAFTAPGTDQFSVDAYRRVLSLNNLTPALYEQDVRDSQTLQHLAGAAAAGLQVPRVLSRVRAIYLRQGREAAWLAVTPALAGAPEAPDAETLRSYYETNIDRFRRPEQRAVALVDVSPEDYLHRVEVAEEDLRAAYEAAKTRRFSGTPERSLTEVVTRDERTARDVFGRLAAGAEPASLGGDGLVRRTSRTLARSDVQNETIAETLFSSGAQPGALAGPVQQPDGTWLVARLERIVPGEVTPFEDVRDDLEAEIARVEAERIYYDETADLGDLIGRGLTLRAIAADLAVPYLRVLPVTAQGGTLGGRRFEGLSESTEMLEALFALDAGEVTNPFTDETRTRLAAVEQVIPPSTPPFEEIEAEVRAAYMAEARESRVRDLADALKARLDAGESLDALAGELGASVRSTGGLVSRETFAGEMPQALAQAVFQGEEGDTLTVPGPDGTSVLLARIVRVETPDAGELADLERQQAAALTSALRQDVLQALEADVREAIPFERDLQGVERFKAQILDQS